MPFEASVLQGISLPAPGPNSEEEISQLALPSMGLCLNNPATSHHPSPKPTNDSLEK